MAAASLVPFQEPLRCTAMTWSNCSSVILRMVASRVMPALLTMMSRLPKVSTAAADERLHLGRHSVTSQRHRLGDVGAAQRARPRPRWPRDSGHRAPRGRPRQRYRSAIANPIPCAPPVITAVRPSSRPMGVHPSPSSRRAVPNIKYDISGIKSPSGSIAPISGVARRWPTTPPHPSANRMSAAVRSDFADILAATRQFIRTQVVPRELEIMAADRVPDDIRDQTKKMGLFGYAIPQEWGGLGPQPGPRRRTGHGIRLHQPGAALDVRHQQRHRRSGAGRLRHRRTEIPLAGGHRLR